jgi:hypothetical protein
MTLEITAPVITSPLSGESRDASAKSKESRMVAQFDISTAGEYRGSIAERRSGKPAVKTSANVTNAASAYLARRLAVAGPSRY